MTILRVSDLPALAALRYVNALDADPATTDWQAVDVGAGLANGIRVTVAGLSPVEFVGIAHRAGKGMQA